MMKKWTVFLLGLMMLLSLAACGGDTNAPASQGSGSSSSADVSDTSSSEDDLDWPKRTITVNVGFKAGGDTDYYARMMAQYMSDIFGEDVIVVNTEGVSGQVAAREVMASDPDGYNCYFSHTASLWQEACGMVEGFSFVDDFDMGGTIVADRTFSIVVSSRLGINTMGELEEYAKAHPGEIRHSSPYGGLSEYVDLQLKEKGIELKFVDVGSSASDNITALLNGTSDMYCTNYANVADYVETGDLVVLGVAAEERCQYLPDVPTLKEQGYDVVATKYYYVNWPKGTDQAIIDKFNDAMQQVSEMPEFQEAISQFNGEAMYRSAPDHKTFAEGLISDMKSLYQAKQQ